MRFFNTEGPIRPDDHYGLPPLSRWDLDEVLALLDRKKYFVLHAPRQTGKTTCLLALMEYLNRGGRYRTLYANIEGAQTAREDVDQGMATICSVLGRSARLYLKDPRLAEWYRDGGAAVPAGDRLVQALEFWAAADPRPAVLLLDEVDALVGDTLVSLLRQLRAGYNQRPGAFPQAVILCGVRDLRDYRIHARSEPSPITGGSAFNIKAESLRLVEPEWHAEPGAPAGGLSRLLASARPAAPGQRPLPRDRPAPGADGLPASCRQRRRDTGA